MRWDTSQTLRKNAMLWFDSPLPGTSGGCLHLRRVDAKQCVRILPLAFVLCTLLWIGWRENCCRGARCYLAAAEPLLPIWCMLCCCKWICDRQSWTFSDRNTGRTSANVITHLPPGQSTLHPRTSGFQIPEPVWPCWSWAFLHSAYTW